MNNLNTRRASVPLQHESDIPQIVQECDRQVEAGTYNLDSYPHRRGVSVRLTVTYTTRACACLTITYTDACVRVCPYDLQANAMACASVCPFVSHLGALTPFVCRSEVETAALEKMFEAYVDDMIWFGITMDYFVLRQQLCAVFYVDCDKMQL